MQAYYKNQTRISFLGERISAKSFFNLFKSKKKVNIRPGAMTPEKLKEVIKEIGQGKKVNITRVEYDGTPENKPITVQIVDIRDEYFTGRVVNLERNIKEDLDDKLVFVKGGGGTIDFYFTDGDIKSVEEDVDEMILEPKDQGELLEILDALDLNESILISYYDRNKGGVINGSGKLIEKNLETKTFKVHLNLINDIELDIPKEIELNLDRDNILDLEVVI
ncbi:MAG TPA: hypothetical protein ENJ10_04810 [Caldithrix abyssi]|uniref:Uncharacterized protein n=1 Tax=Caldithrix abyssi TaxID=187145 RepID=A0A7V1LL43_CALAY|nr:hypothetical protein [Caldithrix abyssi]